MPLPDYDPSKYALLKPGRYMFRITDPPTKHRFGKAIGIILKFLSFSEKDGSMKESSCLIWPWTDEYRILKEEIIQSSEETAWVGRSFMGEIEIGKHPTKLGQKIQNVINIEPFKMKETEEEPEPEVEDTTITPPLEEEGDPGPGEEDAPPEEEETDTTPPPPEEDKPSPEDEEAANKKDFPKKDDEKGGPPW